jgi:hypothetical protein
MDGLERFSVYEMQDLLKFCEEMFLKYDNPAWLKAREFINLDISVRVAALTPSAPND